MKLLRRQSKQPPPEHGDWRVPLSHPEDAEHLPPASLGVWRRMQLRVEYWRTAPVGPVSSSSTAEGAEPPVVPISGVARWLRLLIAWLLLLPLSVVMVYALLLHLYGHAAEAVSKPDFWLSEPVWFSLLGTGTFIALAISRIATPVLVYIYVLGHELTHAMAALISMGRVQAMRIDLQGGYVETDADNLFIALSPYFVPLWLCCWLLGLWSANALWPFPEWSAWFYAGLGFWWYFLLYWTVWVIPREQPDMLENGLLFSLLLVFILNVGILLVILGCFGVLDPAGYAKDALRAAKDIAWMLRDLYAMLS